LWWKSIFGWKSQQIIKQYDDDVNNMNWLFLPSDVLHCDYFSVFTGNRKYQVNNKTDKYIINILEHKHIQTQCLHCYGYLYRNKPILVVFNVYFWSTL
jgi:hypothetical protein